MKYIKTYSDNAAYEADKPNMEAPHVGYIEATDEVKYINDMADLYDIYGTLTGAGATAKIKINNTNYPVSPSGSYNEFGLVFSQPVTQLGFQNQSGIKTLDKLDIDTSAMTNMANMFRTCTALTSLDLSNFNTSGVTAMYGMFNSCEALTSLDVSHLDTSKVTDMTSMFRTCKTLTTLDLSNWDTSAVTNMQYMFNDCNALSTVTMNNTNTTTFDMIKARLVSDSVASHVTIIRDGHSYQYQNGQWVEV